MPKLKCKKHENNANTIESIIKKIGKIRIF